MSLGDWMQDLLPVRGFSGSVSRSTPEYDVEAGHAKTIKVYTLAKSLNISSSSRFVID